jgi:hypothetical protein
MRRPCPYETAESLDRSLGAGDILPTFVTVGSARQYIEEIQTAYKILDMSVGQSTRVSAEWRARWEMQLTGWQAFRTSALSDLNWANAKATMDQTDRWGLQLRTWSAEFSKIDGENAPPPPLDPGQGIPDGPPSLASLAQIAAILGGVAALFVILREVKS